MRFNPTPFSTYRFLLIDNGNLKTVTEFLTNNGGAISIADPLKTTELSDFGLGEIVQEAMMGRLDGLILQTEWMANRLCRAWERIAGAQRSREWFQDLEQIVAGPFVRAWMLKNGIDHNLSKMLDESVNAVLTSLDQRGSIEHLQIGIERSLATPSMIAGLEARGARSILFGPRTRLVRPGPVDCCSAPLFALVTDQDDFSVLSRIEPLSPNLQIVAGNELIERAAIAYGWPVSGVWTPRQFEVLDEIAAQELVRLLW